MLAVAYNFIIEPVYRSWRDTSGEIALKEIKLKKTMRLLENRNPIINEYNTYASSSVASSPSRPLLYSSTS